MRRTLTILLFVAASLSVSGAQAAVIFSDGTFNDADWAATVYIPTNGASQSAAQQTSGGNPGSYRRMVHNEPPAPSGPTDIEVFHRYLVASYQPAVSGAIQSLSYSEDHIEYNPPF